ncbi:MAG: L-aspartate oxidase [Geminicoccaceae bacterium]
MSSDLPVVIVGGGIAGLATALQLAPVPVRLLSAGPLLSTAATALAQGGIAAALGADDAPALHAEDTLLAGAGLCDPGIVRAVAEAGPGCILDLERWGVAFDLGPDGHRALGLEAAHRRRRIVHAGGDATGRAVLVALAARAAATPSIQIEEGRRVVGLARNGNGAVAGVLVQTASGIETIAARAVVLATGGIGGQFAATTNPRGAIGTGLAMAARAGAALRDLEFVQFHPTAIAVGGDPLPLASEAIRGEGAWLIDDTGERFMATVPGQELAPRDVVARHVAARLAAGHAVFLDVRAALGERFARRFPGATATCRAAGIDPVTQPIPICPAAHYHMGGIEVDGSGRATVDGLWAVGEVAATGLHGANRLASNSLLEALAFARWAARDIAARPAITGLGTPEPLAGLASAAPEDMVDALRRLMTERVGVVRDAAGLRAAVEALSPLAEAPALPRAVRERALVGRLIAEAALARRESVGSHYRRDAAEEELALRMPPATLPGAGRSWPCH